MQHFKSPILQSEAHVALMVKNLPAMQDTRDSIPGWGRSPGEGNGNPLQYSCWENPMDRGAWWATVHGVTKGWTQLSSQHTLCAAYGGDCWDIEMQRPSPWPSLESSAVGIRI